MYRNYFFNPTIYTNRILEYIRDQTFDNKRSDRTFREMLINYNSMSTYWYFFKTKEYKIFKTQILEYMDTLVIFAKNIRNFKELIKTDQFVYGYDNTYFCADPKTLNLHPICKLSDIPDDYLNNVLSMSKLVNEYL